MKAVKRLLSWILHRLSLNEFQERIELRQSALDKFLFEDLFAMTEVVHLCCSKTQINSLELDSKELPEFEGIILSQGVYFKLLDYRSDWEYMAYRGMTSEYDTYMSEISSYETSFQTKKDVLILVPWKYAITSESLYSLYSQGLK